ncbi:hypothetical protein CH253_17155 [Rhodococcus sp. 06-156-3C]|nr:hypothetical protein CH280_06480 [Rhodococcus sp. 06-156-4C]OZD18805.1 hypothetical protein CH253_17155 [Rhodococcus sp. 06-156-3C]OZD22315.1 hypothetical protein CH248_08740 [Rhodococcus sp. 06-156-4a]OZD34121.1 hypothetical protein CH247_08565 [Rhodococcus sp. 06-156-3b]OZD38858.1 hypothetical protein CH284_06985 [Rhodococcus sp. 06-156-3]OZF57318.1 hypothetical protein CH290_27770 [Rhodococcus sp. 06-156-4]
MHRAGRTSGVLADLTCSWTFAEFVSTTLVVDAVSRRLLGRRVMTPASRWFQARSSAPGRLTLRAVFSFTATGLVQQPVDMSGRTSLAFTEESATAWFGRRCPGAIGTDPVTADSGYAQLLLV